MSGTSPATPTTNLNFCSNVLSTPSKLCRKCTCRFLSQAARLSCRTAQSRDLCAVFSSPRQWEGCQSLRLLPLDIYAGDLQLLQLMSSSGPVWMRLHHRTCLAMLTFLIKLLEVRFPSRIYIEGMRAVIYII